MIPAPESPLPRRTTRPFPARRHVPGEGPVPTLEGFVPDVDFAWGCDLFDARFYWEAHEVWEAEWRPLRGTPEAELLRGLICAAASVIKHHQGHPDGARRLRERAARAFEEAGGLDRGLDLPELLHRVRRFAEGGEWPTLPIR